MLDRLGDGIGIEIHAVVLHLRHRRYQGALQRVHVRKPLRLNLLVEHMGALPSGDHVAHGVSDASLSQLPLHPTGGSTTGLKRLIHHLAKLAASNLRQRVGHLGPPVVDQVGRHHGVEQGAAQPNAVRVQDAVIEQQVLAVDLQHRIFKEGPQLRPLIVAKGEEVEVEAGGVVVELDQTRLPRLKALRRHRRLGIEAEVGAQPLQLIPNRHVAHSTSSKGFCR